MNKLLVLMIAGIFLLFSGCSSKKQKEVKKNQAQKATSGIKNKASTDKKAQEVNKIKKKPVKKEIVIDKNKLKQVFIKAYCAEKKNDNTGVLKAYNDGGFKQPSDFAKLWRKASSDTKWVEEVYKQAHTKCP